MIRDFMLYEGIDAFSLSPFFVKDFVHSFIESEIQTNDLQNMQWCFTGVSTLENVFDSIETDIKNMDLDGLFNDAVALVLDPPQVFKACKETKPDVHRIESWVGNLLMDPVALKAMIEKNLDSHSV